MTSHKTELTPSAQIVIYATQASVAILWIMIFVVAWVGTP